MNKKIFFIFFIILNIFFLFPGLIQEVQAESWVKQVLDTELIPTECSQGDAAGCKVEHLIQVGINVFKLILGLLGSLALLFFIYGGFIWLLSRGNSQMIEKGKSIFIGSLVGLSLVLASWVIVNFVIAALTGQGFDNVNIFDAQPWWNVKQ